MKQDKPNVTDRDARDIHERDIQEIMVLQTGIFEQPSNKLNAEFSEIMEVQKSYQTVARRRRRQDGRDG